MDPVKELQSQYTDYLISLLSEGFVDHQFMHLLKLQSEAGPEFLFDIVKQYYDASSTIVHQFSTAMEHNHVDAKLKDIVFRFRGANISMGAPRVARECIAFENYYGTNDFRRCLECCQQLIEEYFIVKIKVETLIGMQQQIVAAGGAIPVIG